MGKVKNIHKLSTAELNYMLRRVLKGTGDKAAREEVRQELERRRLGIYKRKKRRPTSPFASLGF